MILKEYMEGLEKFIKENPDALELDVITSKDDEGNGFNLVHYSPSKGIFNEGEFISADQLEDWDREPEEINAVCLN